jgi:hypothetical protein
MTKLKRCAIPDDRPFKTTIELPAAVRRDLVACADCLNGRHVCVSKTGNEPCRI